jgi:peroxiredoxin
MIAATERAIPFPLLSDPERIVITEYGLAHDDPEAEHPVARPATFVIDAAGIVRYGHVGEHTRDRPTVDALLLALASLTSERRG